MGVFPAGSKQHVPPTWQNLMTNPESPIIDFYPVNFKIDKNGKKYDWQGLCLKSITAQVHIYYPFLSVRDMIIGTIHPSICLSVHSTFRGINMKLHRYKDLIKGKCSAQKLETAYFRSYCPLLYLILKFCPKLEPYLLEAYVGFIALFVIFC